MILTPKAPADIAVQMAEILNQKDRTLDQAMAYRALAAQMLATPGTTSVDALAFTSIAASLVGAAHLSCPRLGEQNGVEINDALASAVAFLGCAIQTLETATGVASEGVVGRPHCEEGGAPRLDS